MPVGSRIRENSVFGTVADNPLAPGATTLNSNQLVLFPVISGDHAVITLDPLRQFGDPEIVVITSHTAAATSATIQRGQYGTLTREHPFGTVWVHALLDEDCIEILTSGMRPTNPYAGQSIFETDTNRYVGRNAANTAWQQFGLFFDPPACRVFHNANQTAALSTPTVLAFNSERFDTNGMHDTAVNNSRITFNIPGVYVVTFNGAWNSGTGGRAEFQLRKNGATFIGMSEYVGPPGADGTGNGLSVSTIYKFNATDYVEVVALQTGAAPGTVTSTAELSPEFSAVWVGRGNVI